MRYLYKEPGVRFYEIDREINAGVKMDLQEAMRVCGLHGYKIGRQSRVVDRFVEIPGIGLRLVETVDGVPKDILEKVTQRTKDHIKRVKHFYGKMLKEGFIPISDQNQLEVSIHDEDKLIPENLRRQAIRYYKTPDELTEEDENDIQEVVHDHVKANPHHCEYWGNGDHRTTGMDCSTMPTKYVYEMLADWAATAEERGGKVIDWAKASVINLGGKRWSFSDEAIDIMEDIIPYLDGEIEPSMKRDYGLTFIDPAFLKKK